MLIQEKKENKAVYYLRCVNVASITLCKNCLDKTAVSAQIIAYLTDLLVAISAEEDECSTGKHNCDSNADCVDTTTGFECHCRSGYEGNGTHCISKTMYAAL